MKTRVRWRPCRRNLAAALVLALMVFSAPTARICRGATLQEDFSSNPATRGWRVFGDAALFQWDSTNQDLKVTWDSSQPNSYFYHPLGTILTRADDFSLAFDLRLNDIGPGPDTNKDNTFQIAIGFLNLSEATRTNFVRGTGTNSPNLGEWDYFWDSGFGATVWPTFADTNSNFNYNSSSDYAIFALTPGDWYHVVTTLTASNQLVVMTLTNFEGTAGVQVTQPLNSYFGDFRLDTFSISSYSDAGQDPAYAGSVLAHGVLDNILVTMPAPPVQTMTGSLSNSVWAAQFTAQTNWLYTLVRSQNLQSWTPVAPPNPGVDGPMTLLDTNTPSANAFYRIRADRP